MLKITADFHTHTRFSHGKGDIEDNVAAAVRAGLRTIAISDHGYGHLGFGIRKADLPVMAEKVRVLRARYPQIEILLGMEANLLSPEGEVDVDPEDLRYLDVLMAGYHFGSVPRGWQGLRWHALNILSRWGLWTETTRALNTQACCRAMERYPIRVLTHPGAKGPIDVAQVAAAAARQGVLLEINAHHGHLTVEEIRQAKAAGARFIIGSDAHRPEDVGRFEAGLQRALEAGLTAEDIENAEEA